MNKYLNIGLIVTFLWLTQIALAQDTIPLNAYHSFEVSNVPGYTYSWWTVTDADDTTFYTSNSHKTEEFLWDVEGEFSLFVQAQDTNGCLSEIISKQFSVIRKTENLGNFAGRDRSIGGCSPYILRSEISDEENYQFSWEPSDNLNDPNRATPIFTPGSSTMFTLTVTNEFGFSAVDSVEIIVSNIIAEAGDDIFMYQNSSAILDGTESFGADLQYFWTTISGEFDSGENTTNPVVSDFGTYYLEVIDTFGCVASDSVIVKRLMYAPMAFDDYDTTTYKTEIKIDVLENDIYPDNDVETLTLTISQPPYNGTAYVDYNDFTIHYTPDDGFSGNDGFEYQICDAFNICDIANVYVLVTLSEFLIPDAFSPNGDNINDYFEILGIERYEGNSIMIFNRWGNKVYESVNYGISTTPQFWDGKSNTGFRFGDEELPTGTYYYVLNLGNGVVPIAGSIYLDR